VMGRSALVVVVDQVRFHVVDTRERSRADHGSRRRATTTISVEKGTKTKQTDVEDGMQGVH